MKDLIAAGSERHRSRDERAASTVSLCSLDSAASRAEQSFNLQVLCVQNRLYTLPEWTNCIRGNGGSSDICAGRGARAGEEMTVYFNDGLRILFRCFGRIVRINIGNVGYLYWERGKNCGCWHFWKPIRKRKAVIREPESGR